MAVVKGWFDDLGSAVVGIRLKRPSGSTTSSIPAIIDTGFSGFVQVSFLFAATNGILVPPIFPTPVLLANGQKVTVPCVIAGAVLGRKTRLGVVHVPAAVNTPTLVGMDFLRRCEKALVVSNRLGVGLTDEPRTD